MIFEDKEGYEVEQGSPNHGLEWGKHLGRYDGCYGVGCIMKTIDVVEHQCKH
jgi:hypothetical protein